MVVKAYKGNCPNWPWLSAFVALAMPITLPPPGTVLMPLSGKAKGLFIPLVHIFSLMSSTLLPVTVGAVTDSIGITELKPLIGHMGNGDERARLGVHGATVPPAIKASEEIPDGAYITAIDMDSPAMQVGIQSGDIITTVHGVPVADYAALCGLLLERRPEDTLKLTVLRQSGNSYSEMELEVTLTGTGG